MDVNESETSSFGDFMSEIESSMLKMMRESAKAPADAFEHWQAFTHAIDWKENWIRGLLIFHVVCFIVVLLTRNHIGFQSVLFCMFCAMVMMAETLNSYCAIQWRRFSTQNYFDEHGVFAGILYSAPLLTICFIQLVNFLVIASKSLIIAKKLELRTMKTKRKTAEPSSESTNTSTKEHDE